MCSDPHKGCLITSAVEIATSSLAFLIAAKAIKLQNLYNKAVDVIRENVGQAGDKFDDATVASVIAGFAFLGVLTGAVGVHGARTRTRWCYFLHFCFALFLSLCSFAIFIDSFVQYKKMHSQVSQDELDSPEAAAQIHEVAANTTAAPVTEKPNSLLEAEDVKEFIAVLGFPLAIYFFNIFLFLLSAYFAWSAWKNREGSFQREMLENEPESGPSPDPL